MWCPVLKKQIDRVPAGIDAAEELLAEFNVAKRRPGRTQAEHIRFADATARYLVAYRYKRDGTPRPKSSLAKERTCLNVYLLPVLGNAWIGDLDLPDLNAVVRNLTLRDGTPASGGTKSAVAAVVRRMFAWAREERIGPAAFRGGCIRCALSSCTQVVPQDMCVRERMNATSGTAERCWPWWGLILAFGQ